MQRTGSSLFHDEAGIDLAPGVGRLLTLDTGLDNINHLMNLISSGLA